MTRTRKVVAGIVAAVLGTVAVNALAWNHVHAMTHYAPADARRTANPEDLGLFDKLGVLVWGVSLPRPTLSATPTDEGWDHETHRIPTSDGDVEVWSIDPVGPIHGETLVFHGYGGSKSQLLPFAAAWLARDHRVVLVDFRGSGGSDGDDVTLGWRESEDVRAVLDWSVARPDAISSGPRVLHGFSMGGAAILKAFSDAAADGGPLPNVDGAVVENVFDTLPHTVGHRFERMGLPARPGTDLLLVWGSVDLGANAFSVEPVEWASSVSVPLLVFAGAEDPRVLPVEARRVAEHAPDATFELLSGVGHTPGLREAPAAWGSALERWLVQLR